MLYLDHQYRRAELPRAKWRPSQWSRGFVVAKTLYTDWDVDDGDFLNSRLKRDDGTTVNTFAWHPPTGELVFGPVWVDHSALTQHYGTQPFDEYVRGFVSGEHQVEIYGWNPLARWNMPNEDFDVLCFDGQWALKTILARMLPGWDIHLESC